MTARDVVAWMKELGSIKRMQQSDQILDTSLWHATLRTSLECQGYEAQLFPLDSGASLACVYLSQLVCAGEKSPLLHNELAYLLLDSLKQVGATDAKRANIYRLQLRLFLKTSKHYEAEVLLSWLPTYFLHERALVFARLQNHLAVLNVYTEGLKDDGLAEDYCANVWQEAERARNMTLVATSKDAESHQSETKFPITSSLDVYLTLAQCYYSESLDVPTEANHLDAPRKTTFIKALDLLHRHINKTDPVDALDALPNDVSLHLCVDFLKLLVRSSESERRAALVEHNLLRVEFVNLKYELTQEQIKQQSKVSAVPELTRLGRVISSLAPVVLSAQAEGTESYHVACIRHIFDSSLVLQFHITNNAKGQQMQNVRIHVESLSDADLYVHDSDVPLENLPFKSTGSCYVVFRTHPTIGIVTTLFSCELRFSVVVESGDSHVPGFYLEEIPLPNLEVITGPS